jgi:hypothetical protein
MAVHSEIRIGVGWPMGLVAPFLGLDLSNSFISTSLRQIPDGLPPANHRIQGAGDELVEVQH